MSETHTISREAAGAALAALAQRDTRYGLLPPRHGHLVKSDPQHLALHIAATAGRIIRGGKPDQAPVQVLNALARRGFLKLTAHPGSRKTNWAYGEITGAGRAELARLDTVAAERVQLEEVLAR